MPAEGLVPIKQPERAKNWRDQSAGRGIPRSQEWEERGGRGQWSNLKQLVLLALEGTGKGMEHPHTAAAGMPESISESSRTPGAFHPLLRLQNLPDQLQSAGEA